MSSDQERLWELRLSIGGAYEVVTASSVFEAQEALAFGPRRVTVVVAEATLANNDGAEPPNLNATVGLLGLLSQRTPRIPAIVVGGLEPQELAALREQAIDFYIDRGSPLLEGELRYKIGKAVEHTREQNGRVGREPQEPRQSSGAFAERTAPVLNDDIEDEALLVFLGLLERHQTEGGHGVRSPPMATEGVRTGRTEPSSSGRPLSVFLVHSSGDKKRVRGLYNRLLGDGFAPWLDEEDILPGQNWELEIQRAMARSDAIVVCISDTWVNRAGYVQVETKLARRLLERQPVGSIFVVPARLEKCGVPIEFQRLQWVDLFVEGGYLMLKRSLNARRDELEMAQAVGPP